MKVLLYSDLHGSVKNIKNVIDQGAYDLKVFGGDLFGYFVLSNGELDYILKNTDDYILGNHDLFFLREINDQLFNQNFKKYEDLMAIDGEGYNTKYGALNETVSGLNKDLVAGLFSATLSKKLELDGKKVMLCHGSPDNPFNEYVYPDSEKFDKFFDENEFDVLVLGHSHKAFVVERDNRFIVNPGSCTLPRGGESPSYAVWDTKTMSIEIFRMEQSLAFKRVSKSQVTLLNQ